MATAGQLTSADMRRPDQVDVAHNRATIEIPELDPRLKAFERVEIESTFSEPDAKDHLFHRSFIFDENYEPDDARPVPIAAATTTGTTIKLSGFKEPYRGACPKTTDQIVQRIVEHFLLILLEPNYYGFQKTFGIYYEVTSYDKLLHDARKRNRIFFDKLNVLSQVRT